ncbi:hypothetical protein [Candidatus Vondammii sp. HM_W22]|uniref:hypothetical protein n=1 Tax=Candidatus Vondammii sp. HM_W22 TaxID=2687299 RepID=UPI001F141808|nr:hypothetical protein [Candidatus Vondammii sp. HM_W22]
MRYIGIIAALLMSAAAQAGEPTTPRGIVMAHECESSNPKQVGFSCHFDSSGMLIVMHENADEMSPERREHTDYEFYRLALRFFELGGHSFEMRSDHWLKNRVRTCVRIKGRIHMPQPDRR